MVRTYGLTHLALAVRSADAAFAFYQKVFGAEQVYRDGGFLQAQTPGSHDVIVFDESAAGAGKKGGIAHFGFRLRDPADLEVAARAVQAAGGKILRKGEFSPGEPYLFAEDPDGYEIEIWFEPPTPIDPPEVGYDV